MPEVARESAPVSSTSVVPQALSAILPTPQGRRRITTVPPCRREGTELPRPEAPHQVHSEPSPLPQVLNLSARLPPPSAEQELNEVIQSLRAPWQQQWRGDLCSVPSLPACFLRALNHCVPSLDVIQHVHIFTDGSFISDVTGTTCGWGACIVFEGNYQGAKAFAFAGYAGGPMDAFLQRPLGANNTSYFAEVAAATVAVLWQLSLPAGFPATLWYDCQAVGGVIDGSMSPKAGQGCLSLASRLRAAVHLVESVRGCPCSAKWLPSHAGNPFNELADCVAKAGARSQLGEGNLPHAFWSLLQSPLLPWAWMLHCTDPAMPRLTQLLDGVYEEGDFPPVECIPTPTTPALRQTVARVAVKACSCNVQTLKDKKPLILQQLLDRKIHIAGLQETRLTRATEIQGANFFEFFTAASDGDGGCALLFNRRIPYAWKGLRPLFFEKSHFTCVHSSHRLLVIRVKAPLLDVLVLSAHAPQSGQGAEAVEAWWREFMDATWLRPHQGKILACMDANAQVGSVETSAVGCHAGVPETRAGALLREWLDLAQAFLPATFYNQAGQCVPSAQEPTWISPSGCGYRIDYVALPAVWSGHPCSPSVLVDFELLNKDHMPVQVEFSRQVTGQVPLRQRPSPSFTRDPDNWPTSAVQQVRSGMQRLPVLPWAMNVHTHMSQLLQAVEHVGSDAKPQRMRKCRPFLSEGTRSLLEGSKQCRKWIRILEGLKQHLAERASGPTLSPEGWTHSDICCMLQSMTGIYQALQKDLKSAIAADKRAFTNRAHDRLMSAADPFSAKDFFKALRVLRPPGKKVLKPFASLQVALDPEETHEARVDAQQRHFASLEAGIPCQPEALCVAGLPLPPEARFTADDLPTLLDLETSIRSFRKGKAPGPDGIPDWVWTLDVAQSARALLPVCLKTHIRLSEPIACKSTCLISLFKGKGSPSLVENHRAIALMNGPGKLFRKQLRPALINALPPSEFLQGGLPGSLLQGPHHIVRTHGAIALALRLSAAAVFIDVASAYYRVVRQAFEQGISNDAEVCQILDRLGVAPSSFHTICQWLSGAHLLDKATPHQQRLLREFLHNTHFVLRGSCQIVRTYAGTRPGDSLADLLFALVQADFMQDTRQQLCQAGLLDDQISQLAFGEDKLIAPTWADDSVILQCAPSAETQVQKTQLSLGIIHAEFIRRAMKPNYSQGKTEVVFSLRGPGAPAWRQRLLVRQGGLLSFPSKQGQQTVHCVRHYVHLGGFVQDRPAHLNDIMRHLAIAQAAIKPLRRPVLRDENIPLKVRRMCLQSLALSCAGTTAPTWSKLTVAEDKAWRVGFVKLARTLGRDDRWTGKPTLPDEGSVCKHFGLPAPRVYLRQQRLLHFQRLALSQQALLDLLLAEFRCSELSWLGLLKQDVAWACQIGTMRCSMLDDFPLSLAEWALHEPAEYRTAVRRAVQALKHPAYEPDWCP